MIIENGFFKDSIKISEVLSTKTMGSTQNSSAVANAFAWWIFSIVVLVYLSLTWIFQEFIFSDSLYYRSYSGTLTHQTIEGMLGFQSRYWWTGYVFIPVMLLFKFLFTAISINIGAIILSLETQFKEIFKIAMITESVFIIAQAIFLIALYMNLDSLTLQNASGYFPLSALSLIGIENVNAHWAIYPLQTANLFEVFYVIAISWLLSKQWKPDFVESLNIVLPSYGLGLLLWVVFVAFLTLQIS